jgi:hypothetical protein
MLVTTFEQKQTFKTPEKKILKSPETETVQRSSQIQKTEPTLEHMSKMMTSLGMDDSCNIMEKELVQNDTLWMKEMMTV